LIARLAVEDIYHFRTLEGIDVRAFFSTVPNGDWKVLVSSPANEFTRVPLPQQVPTELYQGECVITAYG
jgi:hypothetical protein